MDLCCVTFSGCDNPFSFRSRSDGTVNVIGTREFGELGRG